MPKRLTLPIRALAVGLTTLAVANGASAQFYGGGSNLAGSGSQAYARGLAGSGQQSGPINFSYNPYYGGGYGGYGGGTGFQGGGATPWSSQYGAWIQPAAGYWAADDIARQQAYYQGKMQYQDTELRRLQLKRAAFDEMRYEKMNTPPPELVREESRLERLHRARNTPPREEITTGDALNELLNNIQRIQIRDGVSGAMIPLSPETVAHINVTTTGDSSGSNEFFKPNSFPDWPYAFAGTEFDDYKKRLQSDLTEMANAQFKGKVDSAKAADAKLVVNAVKARLFENRTKVTFNDYLAATEFLSKVSNTIDTLNKPGAKNFLDGTYSAKGKSVSELVEYMISKGLKFSQATAGFEPDYLSLYQQLVTYELGLSRLVGQQTTMQWSPPQSSSMQFPSPPPPNNE